MHCGDKIASLRRLMLCYLIVSGDNLFRDVLGGDYPDKTQLLDGLAVARRASPKTNCCIDVSFGHR